MSNPDPSSHPANNAQASPRSRAELEQTIDTLLAVCGAGRILDAACGAGALVLSLLRRGVDAYGVDTSEGAIRSANRAAPGRFQVRRPAHAGNPFDLDIETLILDNADGRLSEGDVLEFLRSAGRVSRRHVFITLPAPHGPAAPVREAWEKRFFEAGLRRSPRYLLAAPYETLDDELRPLHFVLERSSEGGAPDALNTPGRDSLAELALFALIARFIRPGDTVLNLSAGLGAGCAALAANSQAARVIGLCRSQADAALAHARYGGPRVAFDLGAVPADLTPSLGPSPQVDALVAWNVEPHVAIARAVEFLAPAGRLFLAMSPPGALAAPESSAFFAEHRYALTKSPAGIRETMWDARDEADIALYIWMKDPLLGDRASYVETCHDAYAQTPNCHVTAFGRDYDHPHVVRALVSIGLRSLSARVLSELGERVAARARPGSSDQGAALCVLAYQWLEGPAGVAVDAERLSARLEAYDRAADDTPIAWRWRVSNRYVAARLRLAIGDRPGALREFAACAGMDVLRFSPLLATKTIDANFQAGLLHACDGQLEAAADCWRHGLLEARRVLQGDWTNIWGSADSPAWFALPEVAQLADLAARCAHGLAVLQSWTQSPGLAWRLAHENHAGAAAEHARWLELERQQLHRERDQTVHGLQQHVEALEEGRAWADQQRESWRQLAEERERIITDLKGWVAELEKAKEWLDGQRRMWQAEAERLSGGRARK